MTTRCLAQILRRSALTIVLALLALLPPSPARAEGFDLGLGLGFVNHPSGFEGGWDFMLGGEFGESEAFHLGAQWHYLGGWTSVDQARREDGMEFTSNALMLTARPRSKYFSWMQFKVGAVQADYLIAGSQYDRYRVVRNSGAGVAYGMGLVFGSERFRFHLLDYERYRIGGEDFAVWSLSIVIVAEIFRR